MLVYDGLDYIGEFMWNEVVVRKSTWLWDHWFRLDSDLQITGSIEFPVMWVVYALGGDGVTEIIGI